MTKIDEAIEVFYRVATTPWMFNRERILHGKAAKELKSTIREMIKGVPNPHHPDYEPIRYKAFEQARQAILKEYE